MRRDHRVGKFCLCCAVVFGAFGTAAGVSHAHAANVIVPAGHEKENSAGIGTLRVAQDRSGANTDGIRQVGFDEKNVLANGSFETGTTGWNSESQCGSLVYTIDDKEAHDGKYSAKIVCKKTVAPDEKMGKRTAWGRWYQAGIPVEKGATYRLTVWVKTSKDFNGLVEIWFHHGQTVQGTTGPTQGEWKKVEIDNVHSKADTANIYLNLTNSTGTVWFDDISLVKTKEKTKEEKPSKAI